jgi:hypothetical protein
MFVVINTFQPTFAGISSFFFVPDPKITLEEGLVYLGSLGSFALSEAEIPDAEVVQGDRKGDHTTEKTRIVSL